MSLTDCTLSMGESENEYQNEAKFTLTLWLMDERFLGGMNPSSPRTLCRWRALRSYTNLMRLALNSGRVTQECEKSLLSKCKVIFLKNYKSYDKTLSKHFNTYLSNLLNMDKV